MQNCVQLLTALLVCLCAAFALAGNKQSTHIHSGTLTPFTGEPIELPTLSQEDTVKLGKGQPVLLSERNGQSGRGFVVQDVHASPSTCMTLIRDLAHYPDMVPKVKRVDVYDSNLFANGTESTKAEIALGVMFFKLNYYLDLTYEPAHNTLRWTLDYRYNSDLDDSVGLWQVMPHPDKSDWTRILYSTEIKLFKWVPESIVNLMTKSALTESTGWVKKHAEQRRAKLDL